jgi:hypothetical protein
MPKNQYRNYEKNVYFTLTINKSSRTYHDLLKDAERHGITRRKLHDLIVTRLGDYYKIVAGEVPDDVQPLVAEGEL